MEDLYCQIYVWTPLTRAELATAIASRLGGVAQGKFVHGERFEIQIRENDDFDPDRCDDPQDGFLYYPLFLETDPREGVDASDYVRDVSSILTTLRSLGYKAVAACDFEDRLPPG